MSKIFSLDSSEAQYKINDECRVLILYMGIDDPLGG